MAENGELLKLSHSQTASNDENSCFSPLVNQPSWYQTSINSEDSKVHQHDKKKLEKTSSAPMGASRIPSFRLSTPNNQGYTRVSYANEKKGEEKKHERQMSRHCNPSKKESSLFTRPKSPLKSTPHVSHGLKDGRKGSLFFSKAATDSPAKTNRLVPEGPLKAKASPVRPLRNAKRRGGVSPPRLMERPTQHHTFLTDAADVKQIEQGLLQLMEDFQAGNLSKHSKLRQMEEIREQQESLARLHFSVGAEQDLYPPLSDDGLRISEKSMRTLMEKLENLSVAIENLHTDSVTERKPSVAVPSTAQNGPDASQRGIHIPMYPPPGPTEPSTVDSRTPHTHHSASPPPIPARNQGHSPSSISQNRESGTTVPQFPLTNVPSSATPLITNIGNLDESSNQPATSMFTPRNTAHSPPAASGTRPSKKGSIIHSYNGQDSNVMVVNANTLSKRIADT